MSRYDAMALLWFSCVRLILFSFPLSPTTTQLGNFAGIALIIFSATVTNTGEHSICSDWDLIRDRYAAAQPFLLLFSTPNRRCRFENLVQRLDLLCRCLPSMLCWTNSSQFDRQYIAASKTRESVSSMGEVAL